SSQRAPGGPWATASSSAWFSRPTTSWPSSPPQATATGTRAAASAAASSRQISGSDSGAITKSDRTWGVATIVSVPSATAARARSASQLAAQGHSYLAFAGIGVAVLLAFAICGFGAALLRARGGRGEPELPRFTLLWACCAAALVAVFAGQESLEGLLAQGHPA